jgi:putative tryptophan/tyrosine transport system substrate-binding protein
LETFRSAAPALGIEPIEAPVRSPAEVEAVVTNIGRGGGAGLLVMSDTSMTVYRDVIRSLAERYRLPTMYGYRFCVTGGGLMSYGIDLADTLRGAATYVDHILRGQTRATSRPAADQV